MGEKIINNEFLKPIVIQAIVKLSGGEIYDDYDLMRILDKHYEIGIVKGKRNDSLFFKHKTEMNKSFNIEIILPTTFYDLRIRTKLTIGTVHDSY